MINFYKYALIASGIVIATIFLNNFFVVNRLEAQLASANEVILAQDSTIVVADGLYERRGQEVTSLRRLNRTLADSLPILAERNKALDRKLRSWTALVAHYEAVIDSGGVVVEEVTGTSPSLSVEVVKDWGRASLFAVLVDSTLSAGTDLDVSSKGVQVQYSLISSTKEYSLIITHDPIQIDVVISKDASGEWVGDVKLPPYLNLSRFRLTTVPERVSLMQKLNFTVGITTYPALITGVGYNGWSVGTILYDDNNYYISRTIPLGWIFGK